MIYLDGRWQLLFSEQEVTEIIEEVLKRINRDDISVTQFNDLLKK